MSNLIKLIVDTGYGSHESSYASCKVQFLRGSFCGKDLYQQKEFLVRAEIDDSVHNERWFRNQYEFPDGIQIVVVAKGATGPRGSNKHRSCRVYQVDSLAPVLEEHIDVGLRKCLLKGRLVLLKDLTARAQSLGKIDTEKGF